MTQQERFYVLEHAGYRYPTTRKAIQIPVEVMVIDRAYCHQVVWSRTTGPPKRGGRVLFLEDLRRQANHVRDEWNEWEAAHA